ncbi:MAG: hypothetical protein ACK4JZ_01135 [Hydrogenophilus thermoluteolus]
MVRKANDLRVRLLTPFLLGAAALVLTGCENSATAYQIEGREHALILVREQRLPFAAIEQFVVVSRLPVCQRRWRIQEDGTPMTPMRVYHAGDLLWALEQKGRWYLATTEDCKVQRWPNPNPQSLGPLVGSFQEKDGQVVFVAAQ